MSDQCVCGGTTSNPNTDCERCQMVAEIVRLKAIVDRLPKTADGVPVAPGMTLYAKSEVVCSYHRGDTASGKYGRFATLVELVCDSGRQHCAEVEVAKCYSTREAAEAAKEKRRHE